MKHNKKKQRVTLRFYLVWPFILSIILFIGAAHAYTVNQKAGRFCLLYTCVYTVVALLIWLSSIQRINRELIEFAHGYGGLQMQTLKSMTIPFAVLDHNGRMVWGNDAFLEVIVNKKAARKNISHIFGELTADELPHSEKPVSLRVRKDNQTFGATLRLVQGSEEDLEEQGFVINRLVDHERLITLTLYDETQLVELERIRQEEQVVVGLLYIDNYEELLSSIAEERQPLTMALIERKINTCMQSLDGICKKLEKDKFLFVIKGRDLDKWKEGKFALMEEIRSTSLGGEQTCSISIGMGVGLENTYEEKYGWARSAIDLALGRGGDQIVIKSGDHEQFFGGKRVQAERNTRVKARVKAHALRELMEGKERVVIMGHSIGDADSFGASVGVYRIARAVNRRAYVVLDQCSPSVKPLRDRFNIGEYEKDMFVTADEARDLVDEDALLVVVDVNKADYTEVPDLIELAQSVVVIDHHRQAGDAIDKALLFYIEPYASSASEMVAEICQYIGDNLRVKTPEAEAMYAGVMIDTNYFTSKTGVRTFEAMAYLRRCGADCVRVHKAFREGIDEYRIQAATIQNTELYLGQFAIAQSHPGEVDSPTVLAAKIANELLDIRDVKASFVLTPYQDKIYISARALDEVNVQVMMEKFGGGGHINMAGAQVSGDTMEEVIARIKQILDQMIEDGDIKS